MLQRHSRRSMWRLALTVACLVAAGSASAAVTCTPVELDNLRIFARNASGSSQGTTKVLNSASAALGDPQLACTFSGTTSGDVTIEAVDAVTTSTVLASCTVTGPVSGGTATCGTITIPARLGWIKIRARDTGGSNTVSANKFGVGNKVLSLGQSNALFSGINGSCSIAGFTADANTSIFDRSGTSGIWWSAPKGCGDIQYLKLLTAITGYNSGGAAYNDTSIPQNAYACPSGSEWILLGDPTNAKSINGPTAGPHVGSDFNGVLWSQGEANLGDTTYEADMLPIQEQIYHASGGTPTTCNGGVPLIARNENTLGIGITLIGDYCQQSANATCGIGGTNTDEDWDVVRRALGRLVRDHSAAGFYPGYNEYDKGTVIGIPHYQRPEDNYGEFGARAALGTAGKWGIAGYLGFGPQITAATKDPSGNWIKLTVAQNGSATDFCAATPASSSVGSCGSGGGNSTSSFSGVSVNNAGNGSPGSPTGNTDFFRVCDGCTANDESMASGTIFHASSIQRNSANEIQLNFASPFNSAHLIQVDYAYGMIGGVRGDTGSVSNPTLIFDNDPKITNALDPNAPGKPMEPTIGMLAASLPPAATGGGSRLPWGRR
jgi:hypothetical protein